MFSRGNLNSGEREDRGNRWVLGAFSVLALLLAYFSSYTDRYDIWTIDGEATRWIGFALLVVGSIVRLWPVFVLGARFSGLVAIQRDHRLVTTGIYRHIRNPSYVGLLVGSIGWALLFRSGVGILIALLLLVPLVARIRSEVAGGALWRGIRELSPTDLAAAAGCLLRASGIAGDKNLHPKGATEAVIRFTSSASLEDGGTPFQSRACCPHCS
jgi:protein-S-isoprenylcysteine O-methyltransferase Ste14